jgi:hypothetical protein
MSRGVQTIQKTAKKFKAAQAIGGGLAVVGFLLAANEQTIGILPLLGGLGCLLYGWIGAWWHHD